MQKLMVFEEKVNRVRIAVDFEASTFISKQANGFWKITKSGEIQISPRNKDKELFQIRGMIFRVRDSKEENFILLKKKRERRSIISFSYDSKTILINFEDKVFAVTDGDDRVVADGCWEISSEEGSIIIDPLIGKKGKKEKKILEIRGVFLQNEERKNFFLRRISPS